jgi:hydroxyacylglutathione hydrolase
MKLIPLPAFTDNYFWLLTSGENAIVVDPGDAATVLDALDSHRLKLQNILITHHHSDHIGGLEQLVKETKATVFSPNHPSIPKPYTNVSDMESIEFLGLKAQILQVPGHTLTHLAYFIPTSVLGPILFCGDTLFSAGCGRMFEGNPEGFLDSLMKLAALPTQTLVCPAHEYTLSNLKFARAVEPNNQNLIDYEQSCTAKRKNNVPTLPTRMGEELKINPFLRVVEAQVIQSASRHDPSIAHHDLQPWQVFATLRSWKNDFR